MQAKQKVENIRDYILNPEFSQFASIILDGELKAASDEYLVFVFENDEISNYFNENLLIVENLVEQAFNKKYKVISTDLNDWEIIKKEFNSKAKKYEYKNETNSLEEILKKENENNDIQTMFGEIVEYE